jgi:hypothetical protein
MAMVVKTLLLFSNKDLMLEAQIAKSKNQCQKIKGTCS